MVKMSTKADARRKALIGAGLATKQAPSVHTPPTLTGGVRNIRDPESTRHQTGTGPCRINIRLEPHIDAVIEDYADALGMTKPELILHAVVMSLPALNQQVEAITRYVTRNED